MWSMDLEEPVAAASDGTDGKGSEKREDPGPSASRTTSDIYYPSWEEVLERQAARSRDGDALHAMFQFHESMLGFSVEETMRDDPDLRRKDGKLESMVAGHPYPTNICASAYLATPL
jgi:hypothetical protein